MINDVKGHVLLSIEHTPTSFLTYSIFKCPALKTKSFSLNCFFYFFLVHFFRFVAAVSVSVSGWTLVAISVERFYAICHPLVSVREPIN